MDLQEWMNLKIGGITRLVVVLRTHVLVRKALRQAVSL